MKILSLLITILIISGCAKEPHLVTATMRTHDCVCKCTTTIQDENQKTFFIPDINK